MDYEPCLPVVSFLAESPTELQGPVEELTNAWSNLTLTAPCHVFDATHYYEAEIGYPLLRWWAYRPTLADPSRLVEWKKRCSDVEDQFRDNEDNRSVNIDPGYINFGRLVMGSHKYDQQKIYLGDGVYADPVLSYDHGEFQPFPWSFPDFRDNGYYATLESFRECYRRLRQDSPE